MTDIPNLRNQLLAITSDLEATKQKMHNYDVKDIDIYEKTINMLNYINRIIIPNPAMVGATSRYNSYLDELQILVNNYNKVASTDPQVLIVGDFLTSLVKLTTSYSRYTVTTINLLDVVDSDFGSPSGKPGGGGSGTGGNDTNPQEWRPIKFFSGSTQPEAQTVKNPDDLTLYYQFDDKFNKVKVYQYNVSLTSWGDPVQTIDYPNLGYYINDGKDTLNAARINSDGGLFTSDTRGNVITQSLTMSGKKLTVADNKLLVGDDKTVTYGDNDVASIPAIKLSRTSALNTSTWSDAQTGTLALNEDDMIVTWEQDKWVKKQGADTPVAPPPPPVVEQQYVTVKELPSDTSTVKLNEIYMSSKTRQLYRVQQVDNKLSFVPYTIPFYDTTDTTVPTTIAMRIGKTVQNVDTLQLYINNQWRAVLVDNVFACRLASEEMSPYRIIMIDSANSYMKFPSEYGNQVGSTIYNNSGASIKFFEKGRTAAEKKDYAISVANLIQDEATRKAQLDRIGKMTFNDTVGKGIDPKYNFLHIYNGNLSPNLNNLYVDGAIKMAGGLVLGNVSEFGADGYKVNGILALINNLPHIYIQSLDKWFPLVISGSDDSFSDTNLKKLITKSIKTDELVLNGADSKLVFGVESDTTVDQVKLQFGYDSETKSFIFSDNGKFSTKMGKSLPYKFNGFLSSTGPIRTPNTTSIASSDVKNLQVGDQAWNAELLRPVWWNGTNWVNGILENNMNSLIKSQTIGAVDIYFMNADGSLKFQNMFGNTYGSDNYTNGGILLRGFERTHLASEYKQYDILRANKITDKTKREAELAAIETRTYKDTVSRGKFPNYNFLQIYNPNMAINVNNFYMDGGLTLEGPLRLGDISSFDPLETMIPHNALALANGELVMYSTTSKKWNKLGTSTTTNDDGTTTPSTPQTLRADETFTYIGSNFMLIGRTDNYVDPAWNPLNKGSINPNTSYGQGLVNWDDATSTWKVIKTGVMHLSYTISFNDISGTGTDGTKLTDNDVFFVSIIKQGQTIKLPLNTVRHSLITKKLTNSSGVVGYYPSNPFNGSTSTPVMEGDVVKINLAWYPRGFVGSGNWNARCQIVDGGFSFYIT